MNDRLKEAVEALQEQIAQKEKEITPLKLAANQLCRVIGIDPLYVVDGDPSSSSKTRLTWRLDQFFNRPLSPSVVEILTARKDAGTEGPASVDEIFDNLIKGGYKFEGASDDNNKRALKIALTKNTAQFVKISDDLFGLRAWYGLRAARKRNGDAEQNSESTEAEAGTEAETSAESTPETGATELKLGNGVKQIAFKTD